MDDLAATLEGIAAGRSGCRQYFVADPDGVQIELMQLLPDSMQARAMRGGGRTR